MENSKRGMRPRVLVGVVVCAGLMWACGDVGLNAIGDAMIDAMSGSGRCLAQDGTCEPLHGEAEVECQHIEWTDVDGATQSMDYALVDAPPYAMFEVCPTVEQCLGCVGDTPPQSCYIYTITRRAGDQAMVTPCWNAPGTTPQPIIQRVIW